MISYNFNYSYNDCHLFDSNIAGTATIVDKSQIQVIPKPIAATPRIVSIEPIFSSSVAFSTKVVSFVSLRS